MNRLNTIVLGSLPQLSVVTPALRERARLQWRTSDAADPATLVEEFLAEAGLPVIDPSGKVPPASGIVGATLYVSAAAAARMAGAPPGAPSPAPAVPDLVVALYERTEAAETPPAVGFWQIGPWAASRTPDFGLGPWTASWTPAEHAAAVRQVRAAIGRGDVYQVNVVGHASASYLGDPMPALHRVAALPGARYGGVLTGDGWALACASPETLLSVNRNRIVTRPIKGTRPATPAGRRELLASAKERAEHVMIVDLARNDLARVARTGSVRVDELYAVRRWCDLWQAESVVSAQLADGVGLAAVLRAVCPGGSVTGAPKLAALEQIAALEPVGRGPAMGALGWVGPDRIDLGLTIRTVAVDGDRVHLWAGGGITWGSDPEAEVAEAAAKATPVKAALAG